jgi:hypothetical protein
MSRYSTWRFGDQDPAVTYGMPVASSAWLANETGKAVSISVYGIDSPFYMTLAHREHFGVAETRKFVAMVYSESISFILYHDSQPELPFNQEFPLGGVTSLYFVGPDGHAYNLICFSPVVTFEFRPYCFIYSQYQHGGRKNIMVGAVVHHVMY